MFTNKNQPIALIFHLLIASRAFLFLFLYFSYASGGLTSSNFIGLMVMYLPSTFLISSIYIFSYQEVKAKQKKIRDLSVFLLYTIITIWITYSQVIGYISQATTMIWLSSFECILDAYICKRYFLDRVT